MKQLHRTCMFVVGALSVFIAASALTTTSDGPVAALLQESTAHASEEPGEVNDAAFGDLDAAHQTLLDCEQRGCVERGYRAWARAREYALEETPQNAELRLHELELTHALFEKAGHEVTGTQMTELEAEMKNAATHSRDDAPEKAE